MPARRYRDSRKELPRRLRLITFAAGLFGIGFMLVQFSTAAKVGVNSPVSAVAEPTAVQDYSRFRHSNPQHNRMPCLLCHKREDNSPTMRYPGHQACAGCHAQQFVDNKHAICSICHTPTSVKRFPGLQSFNAVFDHARHLRQTNCATCHKPTRRGIALTIPDRLNAHVTCFSCHGPRTVVGGRNIGSCNTCHQPGRLVRTSESAPAYRFNFSHQEHRVKGMNCSTCHAVLARMPRGRQVRAPVPAMHFAPARGQNCATCHNDRRAFGGMDFTNCRQCHQGRTFRF